MTHSEIVQELKEIIREIERDVEFAGPRSGYGSEVFTCGLKELITLIKEEDNA